MEGLDKQVYELRAALLREQRKALMDPLTQVWNRAALAHLYPGEQSLAQHAHEYIAVLFIDIDPFKQINDIYGHATGDQVLVEAANRISAGLRASDILIRFGGEEFVVLTLLDARERLQAIAERIRIELCQRPMPAMGTALHITASLGGAAGSADDKVETLLMRADKALYEAKREGRNRSIIH